MVSQTRLWSFEFIHDWIEVTYIESVSFSEFEHLFVFRWLRDPRFGRRDVGDRDPPARVGLPRFAMFFDPARDHDFDPHRPDRQILGFDNPFERFVFAFFRGSGAGFFIDDGGAVDDELDRPDPFRREGVDFEFLRLVSFNLFFFAQLGQGAAFAEYRRGDFYVPGLDHVARRVDRVEGPRFVLRFDFHLAGSRSQAVVFRHFGRDFLEVSKFGPLRSRPDGREHFDRPAEFVVFHGGAGPVRQRDLLQHLRRRFVFVARRALGLSSLVSSSPLWP